MHLGTKIHAQTKAGARDAPSSLRARGGASGATECAAFIGGRQMKKICLALLVAASLPAFAQQPADGVIRSVDRKAGTVTIKHGPIPAIDMPPMTMAFEVKDTAMLKKVKAGDKVKFQAEMRGGGKATVTEIERVK